MPIIAINQAILDFINNLSKDIAADPDPNVSQTTLRLVSYFEFFELSLLFHLITICQIKKDYSQDDHNCIDHDFSNF